MTDDNLRRIGPYGAASAPSVTPKPLWDRVPKAFLIIVALPTLIAAIYYLFIASPRYVSEARFLVRAPNQSQPSSIGIALQGVGLSAAQTDAFAVHEFIDSRDGLDTVNRRYNVGALLAPAGADPFSRYPRFWEQRSKEGLFKAFRRHVTVGYDSTSGISTLRVEAFRPEDAQGVAETLLVGGEDLVNRLNDRSSANAIAEANHALELAQIKVDQSQKALTAFRNRERFIDPALSARESSELIGSIRANLSAVQAERSLLSSQAPNSPQLPALDARISAYERQIEAERQKIAGADGSLAPMVSVYEDLMMNRELADKELAAATASLVTAKADARRQKLYLERIVSPNRPDKAAQPERWLAILTVLMSTMLAYSVGWLIYSGVHEHKQE